MAAALAEDSCDCGVEVVAVSIAVAVERMSKKVSAAGTHMLLLFAAVMVV